MTYFAQELQAGNPPYFRILGQSSFPRRSAAYAWIIDYVRERKGTIVAADNDEENDAMDIMAMIQGNLRQFAVEPTSRIQSRPLKQI